MFVRRRPSARGLDRRATVVAVIRRRHQKKKRLEVHRLRIRAYVLLLKVARLGLEPSQNDGKHLGVFDSWAEVSVHIRKVVLWATH